MKALLSILAAAVFSAAVFAAWGAIEGVRKDEIQSPNRFSQARIVKKKNSPVLFWTSVSIYGVTAILLVVATGSFGCQALRAR
jgi:hypothetical protein